MDWDTVKLSDISQIISGGTPKSGTADFWDGDVKWITPKDMGQMTGIYVSETSRKISQLGLEKSSAKLIPENSVILSTRAPIGHLAINTKPMATNQGCRGLIPRENLNSKFLYYFLLSNVEYLNQLGSGTTFKELSKGALEKVEVPLPLIPEQKRIVAILDKAFAAIDEAKAKTEQNLKNARELFDSYLQQVSGDKKSLGKFVNIKTGKLNSNAAVDNGKYPFFTCSRNIFAINQFSFDCEAILLAGNNASGDFNVKHFKGKFDAYQRTYVITINDDTTLLYPFLYYQILKSLKELKASSVGAGTKFLKLGMIKDLQICIPPIKTQSEIVETLLNLKKDVDKLENIYKVKIKALNELKKCLLQKAFSGELTANTIDEVMS